MMEEVVKEKKKKKTDASSKEVIALQQENGLLQEKILRLNAEMSNMRRHAMEERENFLKYEGEELVMKLLPIVDNFERAIALDQTNSSDFVKFMDGFKMIYANLIQLLKNYGVQEIEAMGKAFDPHLMEAVLTESIIEEEAGIVLDVLQKGYIYKDKVIRHAMVKVNE